MDTENMLLAALPRTAYRALRAQLAPVALPFGEVLYEPGAIIEQVYFPSGGLVSLLTLVDDHLALEVGLVGREGMVGASLALGNEVSAVRALVQGGGPAWRMSRGRFVRALQGSPPLQRGVHGYIDALMAQVSQTAACNRFHPVEKRLARWLLMTRDRLGSDQFRMTHRFLASMLGVRREGVSGAAATLQRRKLIRYRRGQIDIIDSDGLTAAACSCYRGYPQSDTAAASRLARSDSAPA